MSKQDSSQKVIAIIKEAIDKDINLNQLCLTKGIARNYVPNYIYLLDKKWNEGKIEKEEYLKVKNPYNEYLKIKDSLGKGETKKSFKIKEKAIDYDSLSESDKAEVEYDAWEDDKYDDRSKGSILRGEEVIVDKDGKHLNKITGYHYIIHIKGENPLEGEFTRDEMNMVYRLYSNLDGAGLTLRTVSRQFKTLTFRDFKRIIRAFNITKASIPVAPHIIEESSMEEAMDIIFKNKENNLLKKLDDERGKYLEKYLRNTQRELVDLKANHSELVDAIGKIVIGQITPFKISKEKIKSEKALVVYLSDQHVGAETDGDSVYSNDYDEAEFNRRMKVTLEEMKSQKEIFGRFDKIIVCNLGDPLDGYNAETTRGGHGLPQNMNNKEQFSVYLIGMLTFFETLHTLNLANSIEYQCVTDDNHSGDFGYCVNKSLEHIMRLKFPDMTINIFEKFIEHFTYGVNAFILTHGKDKEDKKHGFAFILDAKIENYFNEYINNFKIYSQKIHLVMGDLHQSLTQFGKRFRYKRVSSMYGSSKWIHTNFGYTRAAVDFDIVDKNSGSVLEGRVEFI
jgi:hypothetical protein